VLVRQQYDANSWRSLRSAFGGLHMATILLLALAAAVYPQLLAVVVIILTRPDPKPLLWTCYLGSLVVGVGCGIAFVAIFRSRGSWLLLRSSAWSKRKLGLASPDGRDASSVVEQL
jgi:hypothetical protein